jgi:hypothetical protein
MMPVTEVRSPTGSDRRAVKELGVRLHAGGSDDEIGGEDGAVGQSHTGHRRRSDEGVRLHSEAQRHAASDEFCLSHRGGDRVENPGHDPGPSADDGDVHTQVGEQQRQFDADEPVADDERGTGLTPPHAADQFGRCPQGLEIQHAR